MTPFLKTGISILLALFTGLQPLQAQKSKPNPSLVTGWYYVTDIGNGYKRQLGKTSTYYFLDPKPVLTCRNFVKVELYKNAEGHEALAIRLTGNGTRNWSAATGKSIGRKLAFILDDKLLYAPTVSEQIDAGITELDPGDIPKGELQKIQLKIQSEIK